MTAEDVPRPPVMSDVARLAGVSHQTVSRVLNDNPLVTAATRDRVLAAISTLGYRRNATARALKTRRTLSIGVLAHNSTLYGPASTLRGVEQAAHEAGYATVLSTVESTTRVDLAAALDQLLQRSIDGLVLAAPLHEAGDLWARVPADLPVVVVQGGPQDGVPSVHVDHRRGARDLVGHLLDLGHATVRHLAGPGGWVEADERRAGWREALEAHGAPGAEVVVGDWSPRSGYEAGLAMDDLAHGGAVFVANDQMALGLLRALHERGITVPEQVSVVGFDDVPEAAFFTPPLTTVRQDFTEVGRRSIALVLDQVAGRARDGSTGVVVPAEVVVRASTAAPTRVRTARTSRPRTTTATRRHDDERTG